MTSRSQFLDTLRALINRAGLVDSEQERLLTLLTEARFPTVTPQDLEQIAAAAETGRSNLEREIAESGDPDMIEEMTEDIEEFDKLDYEAVVGALKVAGIGSVDEGAVVPSKKDGQWLLDRFAGLTE